jgi:hypothetical protein
MLFVHSLHAKTKREAFQPSTNVLTILECECCPNDTHILRVVSAVPFGVK